MGRTLTQALAEHGATVLASARRLDAPNDDRESLVIYQTAVQTVITGAAVKFRGSSERLV